MTLGEKIRKYRMLKGWTQKELGIVVGFSAATADSRIRKYERNQMAPKEDMRVKLAKALEVDLSALSDIDVSTYEDAMQVLFLFEDIFGMDIVKKDGKTSLVFDDSNKSIRTLITYLNMWRNQKTALLPNPENAAAGQRKAYAVWKSRFASSTREYFAAKEKEINTRYRPLIEQAGKAIPFAKKTSDITILLRMIIEAGLTVTTAYNNSHNKLSGPGFTFVVNELLNPPSEEAEGLVARFLSELHHFAALGARSYTEMQMIDKSLTITWFIPVASFSVIKSQIDGLLKYLSQSGNENDFMRDNFEMLFEDSLMMDSNDIEEEIRRYCG